MFFRTIAGLFVVLSVQLAQPSWAQSAFSITFDPGAYQGDYFFSGTRYSGINAISLPEGTHGIIIGGTGSINVTVDSGGNVSTLNTDAATAAGSQVTFKTTVVTVDPAGFSGPGAVWHIPNVHPKTSGTAGPTAVALVPTIDYRLLVGAIGDVVFSVDAAGNVGSANTAALSTSGSTLSFNTATITVDPGGFSQPSAIWFVFDVHPKTPGGNGPTGVTVVPGLNYLFVVADTALISFGVDDLGQVISGDAAALTAQGSTLSLNTTTIHVDPGTFTGAWQVLSASAKTAGPAAVTVVPGTSALTYRLLADQAGQLDQSDFTVTAPCSVSPQGHVLLGASFVVSCTPPEPTAYYIDSIGGNDAGAGTEPDPWQSLSMLDGRVLVPGDQVFLKRGSVFRERLSISDLSDGTASQPIIVDAYGDPALPIPVISGGELIPLGDAGWQPVASGAFRLALGDTADWYTCCPALVRGDPVGVDTYKLLARGVGPIEGGISLATALAQLGSDGYFTNIEFPDGRVLYYKPSAGAVPQDFEFEISQRNAAILVEGDHVEIRNVEAILGNVGNSTFDPPVLDGTVSALGANFTIGDCTVAFGRADGIVVLGADSRVEGCVAEHNHSTGIYLLGSGATGSVIQSNVVRFNGNLEVIDLDRGGIGVQANNTIVRGNIVHDNGNIIDVTPPRIAGDAAISLFDAADVLVEGNFVYNSARAAISNSWGPASHDHRIIGNVIYNWNLVGPACDPAPGEPAGSCQNASSARSAISVTAFGNTPTSGQVEILNNTIFSDLGAVWLYGIQLALPTNDDYLRNSVVLNNIVALPENADPRSVGLRTTRSHHFENVEIDFNDVYMPLTPGPNHYEAFGVIGPDMAALGEPGYEINSLHVDPGLNLVVANPADPARYDLLPTSPVIDAGVDVGRAGDFLGRPVPAGAAPDLGAFESQIFCVDADFDGVCDDLDLCSAGPLLVEGFLAPMGPLSPEGAVPVAPDKAFKANRTLPLKLVLSCGGVALTDLDAPPPVISEIALDGAVLDLPTIDLDSGTANDDGLAFRFEDGVWVYNLSMRGLNPGSYLLSMRTAEEVSYAAAFALR